VYGSPRYRHNVSSAWFAGDVANGGAPQMLQEDPSGWFRVGVHPGVRRYMKSQEDTLGQYCVERVVGWSKGGRGGQRFALVKWIGYPLDGENATWQPVERVFDSSKLAWGHLVRLMTPLAKAVETLTSLTLQRGHKGVKIPLQEDVVGAMWETPPPPLRLAPPSLEEGGPLLSDALRDLNRACSSCRTTPLLTLM
jgi:hypothetical protein